MRQETTIRGLTEFHQAQDRMQRAHADLRNTINQYSVYPDVEEILRVGDDLDFDTFTDVSLRDNAEGTSAFVKTQTSYKKQPKACCSNVAQ